MTSRPAAPPPPDLSERPEPRIVSWLDSTYTLIVRIPKPGLYEVKSDGTVRLLSDTEASRP